MPPGVLRLFSHGHMEAAADPAVSSALRASGMSGKEAASYESRLLLFIRKLIKKDSSSSEADFAHLRFPSQLRENLGKPTSECPPSALDPTSPTMPLMLSSRLRPGLLRAAVSVIGSNSSRVQTLPGGRIFALSRHGGTPLGMWCRGHRHRP